VPLALPPWKISSKKSSAKAATIRQAHSGNCERAGRRNAASGRFIHSEVEELLGIQFGENAAETVTTIAGLLSHVSGKLPAPGDKIDLQGYQFEVLDANQTKVLSVRIRKQEAAPACKIKGKNKSLEAISNPP